MSIPFIGRRYTPDGFASYVKGLDWSGGWKGKYPVLHHTAAPSLATRPNGLTDQHLRNLLNYYQNELGWSGAPHLFVDDREDGIIVFQRLDRRGVHARSFNSDGWGIEMLGDYDVEDPTTGRGLKVLKNAASAISTLLGVNGGDTGDIKFHRDDPKTDKSCPGKRVSKAMVATLVNNVEIITPISDSVGIARSHTSEIENLRVEPTNQTPSSWAAVPMEWVESEGFMDGNPGGVMTREMMATALYRYHQKYGETK